MDGAFGVGSFENLIGSDDVTLSPLQMSVRAIIIFFFALMLIRLFAGRAFGKQNPLEIAIAIIVGSNLSRALTGGAPFAPTLVATAAIVVIFWLIELLAARSRAVGFVVKGRPIRLVERGRRDLAAMRRVGVSHADIDEAARQAGIANAEEVEEAALERSGKISTRAKRPPAAS